MLNVSKVGFLSLIFLNQFFTPFVSYVLFNTYYCEIIDADSKLSFWKKNSENKKRNEIWFSEILISWF